MKNQHKREWGIGTITVFLFVVCAISGIAQRPKVPTYDTEIVDKTINHKKDSNNLNKSIDTNEKVLIIDRYEKMPTFPGNEQGLFKFIAKNLRYPLEAIEKGIEGKVMVRFTVRKTGKIENAVVVRGVSELIDKEALRVVNSLPDFIPGEQEGKKVDIDYYLPISFKFMSKTKKNVYDFVEKMPQFPGGDSALYSFISNNIKYPPVGLDYGIYGKVIVRIIVTKSGSVTHVEVVRSLDTGCDKEAIRVVRKLPKWVPGEHNGQKVAVYYTILVDFKLQ